MLEFTSLNTTVLVLGITSGLETTPEQEAEWQKDRDRFIDLTYSPLLREGDLPVSADFGDRKKR